MRYLVKVWKLMMRQHPDLYESNMLLDDAMSHGYIHQIKSDQRSEPSNIAVIWHMFSNGMISGSLAVILEYTTPYVCFTEEVDAVAFRLLKCAPQLEKAFDTAVIGMMARAEI